jgi:hypothetical protein
MWFGLTTQTHFYLIENLSKKIQSLEPIPQVAHYVSTARYEYKIWRLPVVRQVTLVCVKLP